LAILFFAPFNESEQFGLHVQTTKLLSKPVSPIGWLCISQCTAEECESFSLFHPFALAAERSLNFALYIFFRN
jgi:hypothetical protein